MWKNCQNWSLCLLFVSLNFQFPVEIPRSLLQIQEALTSADKAREAKMKEVKEKQRIREERAKRAREKVELERHNIEPRHEKTFLWHMRTTKMQISLRICAVWSAPLLFTA